MPGATASLRGTTHYPSPIHDYITVQVKADELFPQYTQSRKACAFCNQLNNYHLVKLVILGA